MPSEQHDALTALGARWLRKNGFAVVATELDAVGCRERPDVIGFRSSCSAIIEVKVSRSDFLADQRKPERSGAPGVGVYRFYLCPAGLINLDDLPPRWGLLHELNGGVIDVYRPGGNIWPPFSEGEVSGDWGLFQHRPDIAAERQALYSIARRLAR